MTRQKYTNEQLLLDYLNASNKAGKWLRSQDIGPKTGLAYYQTYIRRFGKIINIRELVVKNFHHLIEFPADISITRKRKTDEEILESIIIRSIANGYKLDRRDIDMDDYLPHSETVVKRFGTIKHAHLLASKISEDFAKLPYSDNHIYERSEGKSIIINNYIKACLDQRCIIPAEKINPSIAGFSYRYIYRNFGNIENFRSECAKVSPEFAELLTRHNRK